MDYRFQFRYVDEVMGRRLLVACVLLPVFIGTACRDLSHDNPLDPENPDGRADQIVVVENFIIGNTKSGVTAPLYNAYSQDALYALTDVYNDKMLVLEYHMIPVDTTYQDSLGTLDNEFRYDNEYRGGANRGFPHTFFNGKQTAVQGASNTDLVRARYQAIVDSATASKSGFYCSADMTIVGSSLNVAAQVVRYGNESGLQDVRVEYVIYEDLSGDRDQFTVRKILASEIASLPAGEIFDLPDKSENISGLNPAKVGVILMIKDPTSKRVLQATAAK